METSLSMSNIRWYRCEHKPTKTICRRVFEYSDDNEKQVLYVPVHQTIPTFLDPTIVTASVMQAHRVEVHTNAVPKNT